MKIHLHQGLGYVTVSLAYQGRSLTLNNILLDTGSAGSIFSVDKMLEIGMRLEPQDAIRRIQGVGGSEFVFIKKLERLSLGEFSIRNFDVEIGAMHYGIELNGIIGMNFLLQVGAIINLKKLEITAENNKKSS